MDKLKGTPVDPGGSARGNRRWVLKTGLLSAAALTVASFGAGWSIRQDWLRMGPVGARHRVLLPCAKALLQGAVAVNHDWQTSLKSCDEAIAGLSPATQKELDQLFTLLASSPGRWLIGLNESWTEASVDQVSQSLQGLRTHRFGMLQSAYHALHDIVLGAHYAQPSTWVGIGYPGPPKL
jgi:hypothetical protein